MGAMRKALLFCLFLVSVSSVKNCINNINDLKNSGYGSASPRHGLQLLFWFVQRVDVDQNNQLYLSFAPNENTYGFHYFGNREKLLPLLNPGQSYYSFGKLNGPGASTFPNYVLKYYVQRYNSNTEKQERNMDRLMVCLDKKNRRRILKVFITAHKPGSNDFNPNETYEISLALILQIRKTYCNDYVLRTQNYDDDKEEEERCLQFLTATGYGSNNCKNLDNHRQKRSPYSQCNAYEGIKLQIKTTTQGYSKLIWENIPADIMKNFVFIDIFQNNYSSDPNQDPTQVRKDFFDIHTSSGALDTSVPLNAGLQPQLRLYTSIIFNYQLTNLYIWNGPEFHGANKVIPTRIKGLDASLQLYAEDGKACARLYIKKTFSKWEDVLYYSWVGFYKSSQDKNDGYYTYQYAVKFTKINNYITDNYDLYQYDSSLAISPGVQIRFLLDKKYNNVLAQTTPWESDEKVTPVCDKGHLQPKPSSAWSDPEFFYEPEFFDANNVLPIKIQKYDAGLQLFTKDGKACAQLYIKKTFTDWKKTFSSSWVGFYTSLQNADKNYYTYQYAVDFEKMGDGTKNFDVYQFKSELAIAPGIQIRFLMDKNYDKKLAETEPWKSG